MKLFLYANLGFLPMLIFIPKLRGFVIRSAIIGIRNKKDIANNRQNSIILSTFKN